MSHSESVILWAKEKHYYVKLTNAQMCYFFNFNCLPSLVGACSENEKCFLAYISPAQIKILIVPLQAGT